MQLFIFIESISRYMRVILLILLLLPGNLLLAQRLTVWESQTERGVYTEIFPLATSLVINPLQVRAGIEIRGLDTLYILGFVTPKDMENANNINLMEKECWLTTMDSTNIRGTLISTSPFRIIGAIDKPVSDYLISVFTFSRGDVLYLRRSEVDLVRFAGEGIYIEQAVDRGRRNNISKLLTKLIKIK